MNAIPEEAIASPSGPTAELEQEVSRVVDRAQRKARFRDFHAALHERRVREFQSVGYAFGGA